MEKKRGETIWTSLDRKATAIAEFTMRQYRTRLSTWVVLGVGFLSISVVLLFYIDAMNTEIEAVDNDGDSYDWDGDGYVNGQEIKYGTDIYDSMSHPGLLSPPIEPEPASMYINEDDYDWDYSDASTVKTGYDNDGDCTDSALLPSQKDDNGDGIPCNILLVYDASSGTYFVYADPNVDEDPDENRYGKEAQHRAFILGIGKLGFVFLLSIFIPLFLATGLIREEMTSGTMQYMTAKPIARGEIFLYRMLGYLAIVWPYLLVVCTLLALVSGFMGPGDQFFRFADLGVWFSILIAALLATLVYGMLFAFLGVLWKYGIILALPIAAWELGMALLSMSVPESSFLRMSIVGWSMSIIDSGAYLVWPDMAMFTEAGSWAGGSNPDGSFFFGGGNELPGYGALEWAQSDLGLGMGPYATSVVSVIVLLFQATFFWFIGQLIFKSKEIV
jgi:ABC-type transport system involved in multi-copper enzyme maturation permease subunit